MESEFRCSAEHQTHWQDASKRWSPTSCVCPPTRRTRSTEMMKKGDWGSPCQDLTFAGPWRELFRLIGPSSRVFFVLLCVISSMQCLVGPAAVRYLVENAASMLQIYLDAFVSSQGYLLITMAAMFGIHVTLFFFFLLHSRTSDKALSVIEV